MNRFGAIALLFFLTSCGRQLDLSKLPGRWRLEECSSPKRSVRIVEDSAGVLKLENNQVIREAELPEEILEYSSFIFQKDGVTYRTSDESITFQSPPDNGQTTEIVAKLLEVSEERLVFEAHLQGMLGNDLHRFEFRRFPTSR